MRHSALIAVGFALLASTAQAEEYKSGVNWEEPKIVDPGGPSEPPSDAVILFGGTDLSQWEGGDAWKVEHGVATAQKKSIHTREGFGDIQMHIEFATPDEVKGQGQGRGNSGVYLMGHYEVQILDSYDNQTYFDGQAASIYKQTPPLVNASRGPGEWQTYDIIFERPHFDENGQVTKPAFVTVLHNGVLVQNHFELLGRSGFNQRPEYKAHPDKLPIHLQFHGNPIRFRNIWVREIEPAKGEVPPEGRA